MGEWDDPHAGTAMADPEPVMRAIQAEVQRAYPNAQVAVTVNRGNPVTQFSISVLFPREAEVIYMDDHREKS